MEKEKRGDVFYYWKKKGRSSLRGHLSPKRRVTPALACKRGEGETPPTKKKKNPSRGKTQIYSGNSTEREGSNRRGRKGKGSMHVPIFISSKGTFPQDYLLLSSELSYSLGGETKPPHFLI